jgi:tRNA A-37 threonylcarbamoyl transferase component Bud32
MTDFITRGSIPNDRPDLYVPRPCDAQFDDYLRRNDYIAVIGPRLSGKTSLLVRKFHEMQARQRTLPIYINLSLLSKLSETAWYERLFTTICDGTKYSGQPLTHSFPVTNELDLRDSLLDALEGPLRARVLVILLDDVEAIPKPILTPLMAMIREMFSSRELIPAFKRCVFVLSGCFLPDDLIDDPSISPFRVAERIHMMDTDQKGVTQLVNLLDLADGSGRFGADQHSTTYPLTLAEQIYAWTEGDLYLTQRLCALMTTQSDQSPVTVDRLASTVLPEDPIFQRILRTIERNTSMLKMLEGIQLGHSPLRFTRLQRTIAEAWLMGLIKEDSVGHCVLRNPVYQLILHLADPSTIAKPTPTPSHPDASIPKTAVIPSTGTHLIPVPPPLRGRYQLESLLGRGGMAQVYRATDLYTGEAVAVKELLVELSREELILERFRREGETLRGLSHANIVHYIDLFSEADHHYLVMEYVKGGSLSQLMHREGRNLSVQTAIQIMIGLCDALGHAHDHHIIHRDIKPGNILLTPDYTPRLADFGVAHLIEANRMTETGLVLGTVPYMSPEGCSGEAITPASDLWSVGVVFFEMLTGFLPFIGANPASTIHAIMNAPIPNVHATRPEVPEGTQTILGRLLHKEGIQRYRSAQEVVSVLKTLQQHS